MIGNSFSIMLGYTVVSRWRLPLLFLFSCGLLTGCAANRSATDEDGSFPIPMVKMALVKFPLNGSTDNNLLDDGPPAQRFIAEPQQVANIPAW